MGFVLAAHPDEEVRKHFNRIIWRQIQATLRHPFHRERRLPYLQGQFERKFLASGDPDLLRKGLKEIDAWPILVERDDPDEENRDLVRKIINLLAKTPEARLPTDIANAPLYRLACSIVGQALQGGYRVFEIGPPEGGGCAIRFTKPGIPTLAMKIPNNLYGGLLRELQFSQTCESGAYFALHKETESVVRVDMKPTANWAVAFSIIC